MAKTVSLINMKGGVGKSTLTVNLAWHFAAYRNWLKKVLVVDLDPQFNASQYLVGVSGYQDMLNDGKPTIWDIFEQHTRTPSGKRGAFDAAEAVRNVAHIQGGGRIDLIPSRLELALSLKSPGQKGRLLPKVLSNLESDYDLILIDCAPTESILTTSAYLSSNYILVPVKPEYLSTIGLPLLVTSMQDFKEEYEEHELELAGVVFNATTNYSPEEQHSKREVKELAAENDWYVFNSEVTYSRSYPKGAREGQPIFRTSYARSDQASRFGTVAQEFAGRIGL
ncbi:MAG: ParA family protein [Pyrinomonadaceae bacterium]